MEALAAAGFVSGMDDCRRKPQMLRSVVRDLLPDEKRPVPSFVELAQVLSEVQADVRAHGLLSERHSDPADRKLVEAWRSAVDIWVERILSLASSSAPDKCWFGSYLIGLTCEECCSDRFQSSYAIWFQKLLDNIQSPSATDFIKVPCCASLNDLFTRLVCFPNLKKDGTLFARKVIQPVLQMLNADAGETYLDVAAKLLYTVISFIPSSIQQHYDNVEAVLTSKIMAAKWKSITLEKISNSLAMLPKVKGDGDSWCLVIQKILIAINSILTDAFQGFEEEKKNSEVMNMIVPPGKDPPSPLGGQRLTGEVSEPATRRLSKLLAPRVTTLMYCCGIMITSLYPFQFSIPTCPLLATVGRVLQVDGSFRGSLFPLATSLHQELLCAVLPALHLHSLDLLIAIIKGLQGNKWLVHGANVVRLLIEYFRRARIPSIREKTYDVVHTLLITYNVGLFPSLPQEVINNVFADLTDNLELGSSALFSNKQSSIPVSESFQINYHKKRKRAKVIPAEHPNGVDLSIKACSKKSQAPLSLKIAALKALKALLTMAYSPSSEHWRPDVDFLVINVATNACEAGWANEDKLPLLANFQLTTLEVLLASLLSRTKTQPPYLSQGFDLFTRGKRETGSKIASFCEQALLALRSSHKNLSVDEGFKQRCAGRTFSNGIKTNFPSFPKSDIELLDEDEEVSNIWFENNDGHTFSEGRNLDETSKQRSNASEDIMRIDAEVSHYVLEDENNVVEMKWLGRDETTVDEEKTAESLPTRRNKSFFHDASPNKMDFERGNSPILVTGKTDDPVHISTNTRNLSPDAIKEDSISTPKRLLDLYKGKDAMLSSYDSDSISLDSLPDIVDGDPDSE